MKRGGGGGGGKSNNASKEKLRIFQSNIHSNYFVLFTTFLFSPPNELWRLFFLFYFILCQNSEIAWRDSTKLKVVLWAEEWLCLWGVEFIEVFKWFKFFLDTTFLSAQTRWVFTRSRSSSKISDKRREIK